MKNAKLKLVSVAVAAALGLAACGSNTSNPALNGGKTTSGVITGFGSVFVNGVEYDTTSTSVDMDGVASAESNLKVGMVVNVNGTVDANGVTGTAASISFADETEGFVTTAYDSVAGTIGVMGQTVHITKETIFDSDDSTQAAPSASSLVVGDSVEVSGFSSGSGDIYATRIALKPAKQLGDEIELKGVISGAATNSFTLGGLTITYDSSTTLNVGSGIANGLFVEVKFVYDANTLSSLNAASPSLLASKIEMEGDGKKGEQGSEGEEAELQGTVTAVDLTNNMFMLNGQMVGLNAETQYEDGSTNTSADLTAGGKVEVEGTYDANGDMVATKVHFSSNEADIVETSGTFVAYDATNKVVTFTETGTSAQIQVTVDNMTMVKDDSATADRYFNASKLAAGDMIDVDYDSTSMLATQLERK